ncbi:MAG: response regulator transcription factor [Kiritimatiellia bacterium]
MDDEPKFTQLVRLNLEKTGAYEVEEVNDARQAVATAAQFKPDLIVLDVMMPGMDGGDVDFQLKNHPFLKNVPVVFLTAAVSPKEAGTQGYRRCEQIFLAKPITLRALLEHIETALRNKPEKVSKLKAEGC